VSPPSALRVACFAAAVAAAAAVGAPSASAASPRQTVCTVTVNSSDEKEALRRALPPERFDFVELVERGRRDWLASACERKVACDVLVVSGHYDGGNEFFPDSLEKSEYLPVDELERAACSASCGPLFENLKEVYLFGCNTLNGDAARDVAGEIGGALRLAGLPAAEVDRVTRKLVARHAESSRERMRVIFKDVPALYGFSSTAPLGPVAAANLQRYMAASGGREFGTGRRSASLVAHFPGGSLIATSGVRGTDAQAAHRADVCRFADDDVSAAGRLAFVDELMHRDVTEVRLFLDRIERATQAADAARALPDVAAAFAQLANDDEARRRYLAYADRVDDLATRFRMLALARPFGWLTLDEQRDRVAASIESRLAGGAASTADVNAVCGLAEGVDDDAGLLLPTARITTASLDRPDAAAIAACLGDPRAHARMLHALTGDDGDAARFAQVYLRHRPLADVDDVREVASDIATMRSPAAQARALAVLTEARPTDPATLARLAEMYPSAATADVQNAIAGLLLRGDDGALDRVRLAQTLRQYRRNPAGRDLVDVLIRRLER